MSAGSEPQARHSLLQRPHLEPGESPVGYLDRVARENGYDCAGRLLRLGGWSGGYDRLPIPHTGCLDAASQKFIAPFSPISISRNMLAWADGHPMPKRSLDNMRQRLCPLCLRDGEYRMAYWDTVWASACIRHAVRLIDQCSSCGRALPWYRRENDHCACGADLRQGILRSASPEELWLNEILASHAMKAPSMEGGADDIQKKLQALAAADICAILRFLAIHVLRVLPVAASIQRLRCGKIAPVVQAVAQLLSSWPDSLSDHLAEAHGSERSRAATFGRAWKGAKDLHQSGARNFLLQGFEAAYSVIVPHAAELQRGRNRVRDLNHLQWLTLEQASQACGASRERLRRLIRTNELPARRISFGKTHAWRIHRDHLGIVAAAVKPKGRATVRYSHEQEHHNA